MENEGKSEDPRLKMILTGRVGLTIVSKNIIDRYLNELTGQEQFTLEIESKPAHFNQKDIAYAKEHPEKSVLMAQAFDHGDQKIRVARDLPEFLETCRF